MTRDMIDRVINWVAQHDERWLAMGVSRAQGWQLQKMELGMVITQQQFNNACLYGKTTGRIRWPGRMHKDRKKHYAGQPVFDFKVSA